MGGCRAPLTALQSRNPQEARRGKKGGRGPQLVKAAFSKGTGKGCRYRSGVAGPDCTGAQHVNWLFTLQTWQELKASALCHEQTTSLTNTGPLRGLAGVPQGSRGSPKTAWQRVLPHTQRESEAIRPLGEFAPAGLLPKQPLVFGEPREPKQVKNRQKKVFAAQGSKEGSLVLFELGCFLARGVT